MKTILIKDFISNHAEALDTITDFKSHKLIIKGSCGIGGTSAILGIQDQTIIIISPYTGMIQCKELQRNHNNLFIYEKSPDRWSDVKDLLDDKEHFILNTTPDQILAIKKKDISLYNQIKKIPLFIDECHIAAEADYRRALAEFNHILFNEWENFFTLSTATPVYHSMDIPEPLRSQIQHVTIQRENEPLKDITIHHIRQHQQWVLNELGLGRKVVLFTNEANIYKDFLQFEDILTQPLVGKHLEMKVATLKNSEKLDLSNLLDMTNDLFILSTKFITGFDLPLDMSIGILANEKSQTDSKSLSDIIQAYGRVRGKVLNAAIFYDRLNRASSTTHEEFMKDFESDLQIQNPVMMIEGKLNHTLVVNEHLPRILRQQTYNSVESLAAHLGDHGFNPTIDYRDDGVIIPSGLTLSDKVANLQSLPTSKLKENTSYVFNNIQGDNESYNGFGEHLLIAYAAAYIAQKCPNPWLHNKLSAIKRYGDLVDVLKTFIDANTQGAMCLDPLGKKLPLDEQIRKQKEYLESPLYNEMVDLVQYHTTLHKQSLAIRASAASKDFLYSLRHDTTFENVFFFIETMYVINLVDNNLMVPNVLQTLEMNHVLAQKVKADYLTAVADVADSNVPKVSRLIEQGDTSLDILMRNRAIKRYFRHTLQFTINNLSFSPSAEQLEHLNMRLQKSLNTLSKDQPLQFKLQLIEYSKETQKKHHRWYLLGMASLHIAGHMSGFKKSQSHHREYNIATKVQKLLRNHYTPFHMVEVDIQSSNAQIIDRIFNTQVGLEVYGNLVNSRGISRNAAKVLYNATLNNYKLPKAQAKAIYIEAGYSPEQAEAIATFSTQGKIYADLFAEEADMIHLYRIVTRVQNSIRIHDALIMIASTHNLNLPTSIDGITFRVSHY